MEFISFSFSESEDSTSALTTKKVSVPGFKTKFSIDLAIVREENDAWYRLIHKKTGDVKYYLLLSKLGGINEGDNRRDNSKWNKL